MKHQFVALLIGLSVPVTLPSCMMGTTVIYGLEEQIAALRASLSRVQAETRRLEDERRALESDIARKGPTAQRNRQFQEVNQEINANRAEKAKLEQEIRRLEREREERTSG
jgi:chromosome segregation ATPase